jgi:GT2 family glycosyltransferase
MTKIGFLILHYKVYDTTCQCIDSILELDHDGIEIGITVVDNNSGDGSGEKLRDKYQQHDNIDFILLTESYGFSEGNNIGYERMKTDDYDFIFVTNNDIIFHQKDILSRLIAAYERKSFYLAGPDVYCAPREVHQNPMLLNPPTMDEIEVAIKKEKKKIRRLPLENMIHKLYMLTEDTALYKFYRKQADRFAPPATERNWQSPAENIVLHGSCFIISRKFMEHARVLFTPVTKFYHEEAIMTVRCRKHHWNNVYIPDMEVTHMESISSKSSNYYNNRKFRYVNFIQSAGIYLKYLKNQ